MSPIPPLKRMHCGNMTLFLEVWYYTLRHVIFDLDINSVHHNNLGISAYAGLFVPRYLLEENFCLFDYKTYKVPCMQGNALTQGWVMGMQTGMLQEGGSFGRGTATYENGKGNFPVRSSKVLAVRCAPSVSCTAPQCSTANCRWPDCRGH